MEKLWKVIKIDHTQTAQTVQTIVFFVSKYMKINKIPINAQKMSTYCIFW